MSDIIFSPREARQYNDNLRVLFPEEYLTGKENKTFTFQVTEDCCMACTYCYQTDKHKTRMSKETAKKIVDMLLDLDNPLKSLNPYTNTNAIIVEFIGGEPFLEIDLITYICDYMEEQMIIKQHPWLYRHRYSICSNGLLYFEPKVQEFMHKYGSQLSFSISIDGNKQLHDACRVDLNGNGTYDRAMAAVEDFRKNFNGEMGSKMTLAPENIMYTKDAVIGLLDSQYTEIHLNCVYEAEWNVEHAKIFYTQLKELADYVIDKELYKSAYISIFESNFFKPKDPNDLQNWCGGVGDIMFSVDYKGNIFPCIRYMETSLNGTQKPLKIGHISHGLYVTEEEKYNRDMISNVDRKTQSTEECFYCPIAAGCSWCSAYNYQVFGTVNKRVTKICIMHKARALANAYYWNKIFQKEGMSDRMKIYIPKKWALEIIDEDEWNLLWKMQYNRD